MKRREMGWANGAGRGGNPVQQDVTA